MCAQAEPNVRRGGGGCGFYGATRTVIHTHQQ
jgi:hypothetical protein